MPATDLMSSVVEALALGFASGPVCLASCGPVLLPWMVAVPEKPRVLLGSLALFLGGRLAGYLLFAAAAWAVGMSLPADAPARTGIFGLTNLILAALLALYAWSPRTLGRNRRGGSDTQLYQIEPKVRTRRTAALVLGFLTGLNLCPPFVAAGVRAAEIPSLPGALLFFLAFFAGTAVWFLPALAVGPLNRIPAASTVARMVLGLMAAYYAYLGLVSLYWRWLHV
jgi:sulfite exporter TauE/SafE